jgi:tetratricopeptide (TPR) repeat protein
MADNNVNPVTVTSDSIYIWLDQKVDDRKNSDTKALIRQLVKGRLQTYIEPDLCVADIYDLTTEKVTLIISNLLGQDIVPVIHDVPQIQTIYIYCGDEQSAKKWSKSYKKISGIFTDKKMLLNKIYDTVRGGDEDSLLPMSIFHLDEREKSLQKLTTESATFMWYRSVLNVLRLMAKYCNSKTEMITECLASYHDNEVVKDKINEFEKDYAPTKAFWWYTNGSFLYRLLNRALRTQNTEIIFKFRFIINDLHNQIEQHYQRYLNHHSPQMKLTIYRGQRMRQIEIDVLKHNVNQLISMNSFLSATSLRAVAEIFADTDDQKNEASPLQSVIFIIDICDMSKETTPFAFIENYSCSPDEREILFTIGAVFKVESVKKEGKWWHVNLKLSKEQNELSQQLNRYMMQQIGSEPGPLSFGWFLYRTSDFPKAERYAESMIKQFPPNDKETGNAYSLLGLIYKDISKLEKCVECYEKALHIYSGCNQPESQHIIAAHYNLALAFIALGDHQNANEHRKQAEEKLRTSPQINDPLYLAIINTLRGKIQIACGDYEGASENLKAALERKRKRLPIEHPSIGSTLNELGVAEEKMRNYEKALEYYKQGFAICQKALTEKHLDLVAYHTNIGRIYYIRREYKLALKEFKLAVDIITENIREDTEIMPTLLMYIDEIQTKLNQ